jgi:hypothetical protein
MFLANFLMFLANFLMFLANFLMFLANFLMFLAQLNKQYERLGDWPQNLLYPETCRDTNKYIIFCI